MIWAAISILAVALIVWIIKWTYGAYVGSKYKNDTSRFTHKQVKIIIMAIIATILTVIGIVFLCFT